MGNRHICHLGTVKKNEGTGYRGFFGFAKRRCAGFLHGNLGALPRTFRSTVPNIDLYLVVVVHRVPVAVEVLAKSKLGQTAQPTVAFEIFCAYLPAT